MPNYAKYFLKLTKMGETVEWFAASDVEMPWMRIEYAEIDPQRQYYFDENLEKITAELSGDFTVIFKPVLAHLRCFPPQFLEHDLFSIYRQWRKEPDQDLILKFCAFDLAEMENPIIPRDRFDTTTWITSRSMTGLFAKWVTTLHPDKDLQISIDAGVAHFRELIREEFDFDENDMLEVNIKEFKTRLFNLIMNDSVLVKYNIPKGPDKSQFIDMWALVLNIACDLCNEMEAESFRTMRMNINSATHTVPTSTPVSNDDYIRSIYTRSYLAAHPSYSAYLTSIEEGDKQIMRDIPAEEKEKFLNGSFTEEADNEEK